VRDEAHFSWDDVAVGDEAVRVLLWLNECRSGDPGAARADDRSREVRIELEEPLAGRVPYDGVYKLVRPEARRRALPLGGSKCAIVRLEEPLGGCQIRHGAPPE
jgi:hypothetical protein